MITDPGTGPRPVGTFWLLDLEQQEPPAVVPRIAAGFQRVGPEAASALAEAMLHDGQASVLDRFASGRRCYVAWVEGVLAAYGWVSFGEEWISELGLSFRLAPSDAYVWDCATLPAYRGQRLFPALHAYILHKLRAEGVGRVWIGANTESVASQKGFILAGFRPVADVFLNSSSVAGHPLVSGRPDVPEDLVRHVRESLV